MKRSTDVEVVKKARAFFEAIPESKWCVNKMSDDVGRCCAIGHWRQRHRFTDLYLAILGCYQPDQRASIPSLAAVNDGMTDTDLDLLATPRLRVLTHLDRVIAQGGVK